MAFKKQVARCSLCLGLLLATGCSSSSLFTRNEPSRGMKNNGTTEHFAKYWNDNCNRIQSLRCDNVDIDVRAQRDSFSLDAKLAYQRNQRFRLVGHSIVGPEVDLGSNEQEIWFWIARGNPPSVYFCNREDLPRVKLATPFQPDWIIEVLGAAPVDLNEYSEDQSDATYFTLVAKETAPSGQQVTKRLVINRQTNRVEAFQIFSKQKKLMEATILEYQDVAEAGCFVPRKIRIEWPDAETRLDIAMRPRKVQVNSISPDLAASLFRRGEYTNTEIVNLATLQDNRVQTADAQEAVRGPNSPRDGRYDRRVQPTRAAAELTGQIQTDANMPASAPAFYPAR